MLTLTSCNREFVQHKFKYVPYVLRVKVDAADERHRNIVFRFEFVRERDRFGAGRIGGVQDHGKRLADFLQFIYHPLTLRKVACAGNLSDRPSEVTSIPMVACSLITFSVPISAASDEGHRLFLPWVLTILG
jgi:hypothetical protein